MPDGAATPLGDGRDRGAIARQKRPAKRPAVAMECPEECYSVADSSSSDDSHDESDAHPPPRSTVSKRRRLASIGDRVLETPARALLMEVKKQPSSSDMEMCQLLRLPSELVVAVMSALDGDSLVALSGTCRSIRNQADSSPASCLWDAICKNTFGMAPPGQADGASKRSFYAKRRGLFKGMRFCFPPQRAPAAEINGNTSGNESTTAPASLEEMQAAASLVPRMGGIFNAAYTSPVNVDYVVSTTMDLPACQAALEKGTPVLRASWVAACLTVGELVPTSPHRLPLLSGLVFSVTGLPHTARATMRRLAAEHGARFTPALHRRGNTHLIAASTDTEKFRHAVSWGIRTVSCAWLYESVVRSRWLDERMYPAQASHGRRTPPLPAIAAGGM
eukprot:tig00000792_g4213.t1